MLKVDLLGVCGKVEVAVFGINMQTKSRVFPGIRSSAGRSWRSEPLAQTLHMQGQGQGQGQGLLNATEEVKKMT